MVKIFGLWLICGGVCGNDLGGVLMGRKRCHKHRHVNAPQNSTPQFKDSDFTPC
jgi:hypothetical protein